MRPTPRSPTLFFGANRRAQARRSRRRTDRARMLSVRARRSLVRRGSSIPGRFRREEAPQPLVLRGRRIESLCETLVRFLIEDEQPLVQQHLGRLPAGRLEHEFRAVLSNLFRRPVDQRPLGMIGAQVDRNAAPAARSFVGGVHRNPPLHNERTRVYTQCQYTTVSRGLSVAQAILPALFRSPFRFVT